MVDTVSPLDDARLIEFVPESVKTILFEESKKTLRGRLKGDAIVEKVPLVSFFTQFLPVSETRRCPEESIASPEGAIVAVFAIPIGPLTRIESTRTPLEEYLYTKLALEFVDKT